MIEIANPVWFDTSKDIQNNRQDLFENFAGKEETMIEIRKEDVSKEAMKLFESYSERDTPWHLVSEKGKRKMEEKYTPWDFNRCRCVIHTSPAHYITYMALHKGETIDETPQEAIYLFDQTPNGDTLWHGRIALYTWFEKAVKEFHEYENKPFIGFTETESDDISESEVDYRRKWYGKKRLEMMNQVAQETRWLNINSNPSFCHDDQERTRKRLVQEGKAKKYTQTDWKERYCFI